MATSLILEERVRFGAGDRLAGVLHYPAEATPDYAVLLFPPHPNFAGDMDNNVIQVLAQRLASDAITLRFDYRGIGQSRITLPTGLSLFDYWEDLEEKRAYADPLADAADAADALWHMSGGLPMIAVGYSFGSLTGTRTALGDDRFRGLVGIAPPLQRITFDFLADCPKPCLFLSGEDDFIFDAHVADQIQVRGGTNLTYERIPGMDHFARDWEAWLADHIAHFVDKNRRAHGPRQ